MTGTFFFVLAAFVITVLKFWINYGAKLPLIFIASWIAGIFVIQFLELTSYAFMSYQCLLTVSLILIERYKAYSSKRLF